jgi:hypothetical protein
MSSYQSGPYCKHCVNLNRTLSPSDRVPVDHYLRKTRDPNSPVICPELLKTKCPECGIYGHTKFYCLNKMTSWRSYEKKFENLKQNIIPPSSYSKDYNVFANLSNDSDSDNDNVYDSVVKFRPNSPDYPPPDWENT